MDATTPEEPEAVASIDEPAALLGPQISFEKTTHDFGEIWDVESSVCQFPFTNTGDQTLIITDIKASCGCTATTLEKRRFEPGEGSSIEVVFSPRGPGLQSKHINVIANAAQDPPPRLFVRADVQAFVTVEPRHLRLGVLELGKPHSASLLVSSVDPAMVIESVDVAGQHLAAGLDIEGMPVGPSPSSAEPERQRIKVTLADTAPWGALYGSITLNCRGRLEPDGETITHSVTVSVSASLYGELHADQNSFRLGVIPSGESVERTIRLTRPSGEPFSILDAEILRPSISDVSVRTAALEEPDVSGYDIILSADVGDFIGAVNGVVVLTTDVPGEEQLELNFGGIVRE